MRVTPEATAVADANLAFYRALEARDLETMARVWYHDESVSCVHPGWHRLDGWDEVERSWENIFTNSRPWAVSCEDIRIALAGDLAWVTCVEVIVPFGGEDGSDAAELLVQRVTVGALEALLVERVREEDPTSCDGEREHLQGESADEGVGVHLGHAPE